MITKRINLLAGTILGGALLLGTAGLAFAQDPTTNPSPQSPSGMSGGMMGGQGASMMGGQGQRLMGGPSQVQGMMGAGMGAGRMPDMTAMHAAMGQDGTCDPELMQSMHKQVQPTR